MKANELRIGNYIELDGKVERIWEISMDYKDEGFPLFSAGTTSLVEFRECRHKPIPLTEEWLEKFDLVYVDLGQFIRIYGHDFLLSKIKYVHQLQNLYFALTGEELTIK